MGLLILRISFGRTKYIDFQLDLELHLPGVTVERYFAYSQGSRLKAYEAMKLIIEAFLAMLILWV
jgi:hypothetical protein